jgi:hypothetical protein
MADLERGVPTARLAPPDRMSLERYVRLRREPRRRVPGPKRCRTLADRPARRHALRRAAEARAAPGAVLGR